MLHTVLLQLWITLQKQTNPSRISRIPLSKGKLFWENDGNVMGRPWECFVWGGSMVLSDAWIQSMDTTTRAQGLAELL